MDRQRTLLIAGVAVAAVVILILLARRQTAIVQSPQVGRVGTAPGPDTTGAELAFKSNIFGTYASYLKAKDANTTSLEKARISAGTQSQSIAASLEAARLREQGLTDRTRTLAETNQFAAANAYDLKRREQSAANTANILRAITNALGSLAGVQRGGSSGGSGGGVPGYPSPTTPSQTPARRPNNGSGSSGGSFPFGTPPFLPSGYGGPLFPGGYTPAVDPAAYTFFPDIGSWFDGFDNIWGGYDPGPPTKNESEDPVITYEDPGE